MTADDRQQGETVGRLTPGTVVAGGRYRVERLLGVWGIRAFYQVEATSLQPRALLAEFALTGGMAIAERAQRLMALEHPLLPAVREYFQQGDVLYLTLNLGDGETLEQVLARMPAGQCDEAQVTAWGIQLCDGLAYLQSQSPPIAVADLAPSAIFVTTSDRVKLVGLGHVLGLYTRAGLVGALEMGYAAPEVYLGHLDGRTDVYALGALLYTALSGSSPAEYTPGSLPPLRTLCPAITPELATVVEHAITQHPEERWPDAASFGAALRQAAVAIAARGVPDTLSATDPGITTAPSLASLPNVPSAPVAADTQPAIEDSEVATSEATGAPEAVAGAVGAPSAPASMPLPEPALTPVPSEPTEAHRARRPGLLARLLTRRRGGPRPTRG